MWLTVKELGDYLNIKEKTIYYWVENNSIPFYRIGKLVRFKKPEVDVWMNSKKSRNVKQQKDTIVRSVFKGKPDRLKKEVI
jgi:excisionase family DNA binding protein